MSKKKVIGFDINEILRARSLQFNRYYVQEFGEENLPEEEYVYDFWKNYIWKDTEEQIKILKDEEELPEINAKFYQVDEETGQAKADAFIYNTELVKKTARENYNTFMYEDFCFEIFGTAPRMYKQVDLDFDIFYKKFSQQFEFVVFSKENWFSIPPTLFFLSKITPRVKRYLFTESNEEIWDEMDIIITTDPDLLENKPKNKKTIKLDRPYNGDSKSDYSTLNFIDLMKDEKFFKVIGFKPEKQE